MAAVLKFMWLNPVASTINAGYLDNYVFDVGDFWDPGVISSGYYANYMKVAFYGLVGFDNLSDLRYFESTFTDYIDGGYGGFTNLQNEIGWTIPTGYGPNGAEIRPERATISRGDELYYNGYYWDPIIIYCDTNWGTNENSTVTFDTTGVPNCPVSSVSMSPLIVNLSARMTAPTLTTNSVLRMLLPRDYSWIALSGLVYVERQMPFYPAHYIHYSPSLEGGIQMVVTDEAYTYASLRNTVVRFSSNTSISNVRIQMLNDDVCVLNARSMPTIDGVQYTMRASCNVINGYNYLANTPTVNPTSGYIPYNGTAVQIPNYDYIYVLTTQFVLMTPQLWWFHNPGDSYSFDLTKNASNYNCWWYYTYGTRTKLDNFTINFSLPGYTGVTDNTVPLSGNTHTFTSTWNYFPANDPTFDITNLDDNFSWNLYNWDSFVPGFNDTGPADYINYDDLVYRDDYFYGWMYTNVVLSKTLTGMPVNTFDEGYYFFYGDHFSSEAIFQIEIIIPDVFDSIDDLRNAGYDLYSLNGTPLYEAIDRGEYKIVTGKNIVRLRLVTKVTGKQLFTAFLQLRNKIMKIDVSQYLDRDIILDLDLLKPNLFGDNMFLLYVEFKDPDTGETTQTLELAFTINFWHYNHLLLKPGTFGPNGLIIDKYLTADNCDEYKLPYIH